MILSTPLNPAMVEANMVAMAPTDAVSQNDLVRLAWFPWGFDESNGEVLCHLSSFVFLRELGLFTGYADASARSRCVEYLAEAARTFNGDRLRPTGSYPWASLFTKEWVPKEYQVAGMERCYVRATRFARGNLIGDSVGLGKTITAIGVMARLRREGLVGRGPGRCCVVITKAGAKGQWKDEIARFDAGAPRVSLVDGSGAKKEERLSVDADVYITNYELFRIERYLRMIEALRPACLVLDETAAIANPESRTSVEVVRFAQGVRYAFPFNATPIENGLGDTFPQYACVDRHVLGGDFGVFRDRYFVFDLRGKRVGYRRIKEFRRRTAMCYVRRTNADCGEQMPAVVAEVRPCEMGKAQAAAYRLAVGEFLGREDRGAVAGARLAKVRYAAFAADVMDPGSESCKMDDLEEMLSRDLAGERVVVFSAFRRVIEFASRRLAAVRPWVIHGGTSRRDRDDIRRRFNTVLGDGKVLLCTTAAERALNLQSAGVVYNLDMPWNHARLRQRVGRVCRIGQTRSSVLVLNAEAKLPGGRPTVDGWFFGVILPNKRGIFDDVFGDDGVDEVGAEEHNYGAVRKYLQENR